MSCKGIAGHLRRLTGKGLARAQAKLLAEAVGIRWALAAGSGIMTAGGAWLLLSPVWRVTSLDDARTGYDTSAR